jgi:hypothetical protein
MKIGTYTRGRGYLRRGKWIGGERFVSGRGECVCVKDPDPLHDWRPCSSRAPWQRWGTCRLLAETASKIWNTMQRVWRSWNDWINDHWQYYADGSSGTYSVHRACVGIDLMWWSWELSLSSWYLRSFSVDSPPPFLPVLFSFPGESNLFNIFIIL